jgi:hypothetical protein
LSARPPSSSAGSWTASSAAITRIFVGEVVERAGESAEAVPTTPRSGSRIWVEHLYGG